MPNKHNWFIQTYTILFHAQFSKVFMLKINSVQILKALDIFWMKKVLNVVRTGQTQVKYFWNERKWPLIMYSHTFTDGRVIWIQSTITDEPILISCIYRYLYFFNCHLPQKYWYIDLRFRNKYCNCDYLAMQPVLDLISFICFILFIFLLLVN